MSKLSEIPTEKLRAALAFAAEQKQRLIAENALAYYRPYARQGEFHTAGASHRERLLMAANQSGKTLAGGMEAAMHATGRYPDWWEGKRFDRPTIAWVAGETAETVRDTVQRVLIGRTGSHGVGTIPKDCLLDIVPARGVPEAVDIIRVRHVSGGASVIGIKSYADGRAKFQGETLDWVWLDEEPPADIYSECLTRTNVGSGPLWITFTPLLGMSETVRRFVLEKSPDRCVTQMTIDDVQHFTDQQREQIISSYAPHEREARTKGIPTLGSGRVFPVAEADIVCEPFGLPTHWPRIGGMDFGWDHPFAAVELCWDRDGDVIYVTKCYRLRQEAPVLHASALRPWNLQWAWPRDGNRETLEGAGIALAEQYRREGLDMLFEYAQFESVDGKAAGSVSVEAGIMEMLTRMQTGRWKVFNHLNDWLDEFRLYHRKDGKVVKELDDLLCASRYAMMMKRFAKTAQARKAFYAPLEYPKRAIV
jgi:phage terminase large subunit-like protein